MSEEILDIENSQGNNEERPTFLTVLCILTFIGSGLGILGGLIGAVGNLFSSSYANAPGSGVLSILLGIISSALCLFGAIQMWQLRKSGFNLYVAGSTVYVAVAIMNAIQVSSMSNSMSNTIYSSRSEVLQMGAWVGVVFGVIIVSAFVAMYSANRKSLIH